jgi:hypothetical protein
MEGLKAKKFLKEGRKRRKDFKREAGEQNFRRFVKESWL